MAQSHQFSGSAGMDYQQSTLPMPSANQYSDSLAYWHIPHPQYPGPSISQPYDPQRQPVSQSAPEHKKHKRTRSGCFTCRARRVKCDEARPVCERCKKGNRDCVYPTAPLAAPGHKASAPKTKSGISRRATSQESDSSDHGDVDESTGLNPIADQEEGNEGADRASSTQRHSPSDVPNKPTQGVRSHQSSHSVGKRRTRRPPDNARAGDSTSPSADSSTQVNSFGSQSPLLTSSGLDLRDPAVFAHLPERVQFYLKYHQESLTHYHLFLKSSADHFIHQTMVELALRYEPLLYAIVGFAAYHHSMRERGGKLSTFLKYYSTALTLLRKSLSAGEPHTEATLLTVLVLTTFEEYIGDLMSLIDHHQAANALMLELLTPDSINTSDLHEHLFVLYARFDVVVGILAGHETVLSRDWYVAKEVYDREQAAMYPDDLDKQIKLACSLNRRSGLDLAALCAKVSHGMISRDEFETRSDHLSQTFEKIKDILLRYSDSEHIVRTFPNKKPLTEDDIVDPYVPGSIHQGPQWELNFMWIDLLATILMFKWQRLLILQRTPLSELQDLCMEICRLMETIDRWPATKEPGYLIGFKNALGFACFFIPQTEQCTMWCRRNLARLEQNGIVYAPKFRAQLAAAWNMPELNHWWLPNDEGYPQIAREIRAMIEERSKVPRDGFREDVRDLKTLFWKMTLDDAMSDGSPNSSRSGNP